MRAFASLHVVAVVRALLAAARLARLAAHPHRGRRPRRRLEVAAGLLATLPGTPMVFAGDELGLTGVNGEDSRTPMPWHRPADWDRATLAATGSCSALRRAEPALRHGGLRWLHADADMLVFLRESADGGGCWCWPAGRRARRCGCRAAGGGEPVRRRAGARPGPGRLVTLPGDGPTFQVWRLR